MTRHVPTIAQLPLPLGRPKGRGDTEALSIGRRVLAVRLVRNRRARHYIIRVELDGSVRVTIPRSGTLADARRFLARQLRWVDLQRYAAARIAGTIFFRGALHALQVKPRGASGLVEFADEAVAVRPGEPPKAAASRRLRDIATRELGPRLKELARALNVAVSRVTIRSQETRWGSCSADGHISLNWRLVGMPGEVRDYILIHELTHLRERGHTRRFWRLVEQACPGQRAARAWLRAHGQQLR
jgi:predicted metal-dependent hydrolase